MSFVKKTFLLIFFILLFSTCAIVDLNKIIEDPEVHPIWDVDASFLLFEKIISFEDAFSNIKIDAFSTTNSAAIGATWPLSVTGLSITSGAISMDTAVDLNDDGADDLTILGLYSTNASLTLTIWLSEQSVATNIFAVDAGQFSVNSIDIEGKTYYLTYSHTTSDNKLVYAAVNFLDPAAGYYFPVDSSISVDNININLNDTPATPSYTTTNLQLNFQFDFSIGDYSAVGAISGINVFTENNIAIGEPITSMSVKELDDVIIECSYESALAASVATGLVLSAAPNPSPSPDTFNNTFVHGNYSYDSNGYNYVSGVNKTSFSNAIDDIPTLDKLIMNVTIDISATSGAVRISPKDSIKIRVKLKGKTTIGL